eukprot:3074909-Rhodomonas_salina.1
MLPDARSARVRAAALLVICSRAGCSASIASALTSLVCCSNLIGEDHEEHVRDTIQTEAAWGHKQPNQFLYGQQVVQPGHVQADVAPWERIKGVREQPQTAESKAELRKARGHLPG